MNDKLQFVRVEFTRFKAFERFTLRLKNFNILVGPNNAGKSTILAAFRILSIALKKATSRKPQLIMWNNGHIWGYHVDLRGASVAEENIFFNYDDSLPASVVFTLSNKNSLTLSFPEQGVCVLVADGPTGYAKTPANFRKDFNCAISFVPILGPVEHNEPLYQQEAARNALFNYRAARNFRNIWYHFPDQFDEFREALQETWPGMDIEKPIVSPDGDQRGVLHMFCPEERIPREIFWAGFGFQVWCQMLTHLVQSRDTSIFLIDEPDIYLHSDLQRQLLGLLKNLGPDILIATHSTEIITEAEPDDIVLINKQHKHAKRIRQPSELSEVFAILGSNLNPTLTQLAKTRKAMFVEGKDFQIVSKIARKLKLPRVANRSNFAVVPIGGFSPDRVHSLKNGIESTLGESIEAAVILDRDYRSETECKSIEEACKSFAKLIKIHCCKEIENFLLIPSAIDRAADKRVKDRAKRTGKAVTYSANSKNYLDEYANSKETFVMSRYLSFRQKFDKNINPGRDTASSNEEALAEFKLRWEDQHHRFSMIPGKEAISYLNVKLQSDFNVSVTPTGIIDAMHIEDIPTEIVELITAINNFSK